MEVIQPMIQMWQSFSPVSIPDSEGKQPDELATLTEIEQDRAQLRTMYLSTMSGTKRQTPTQLHADLEVYADAAGTAENSIFQRINSTTTVFGEAVLWRTLADPYSRSTDQLELIQDYVQQIAEDADLRTDLERALKGVIGREGEILWFWKKQSEDTQALYDSVYFNFPYMDWVNEMLNEHELVLQLATVYKLYISPGISIFYPLATIIIPILLIRFTGINLPMGKTVKMLYNLVFQTMSSGAWGAMGARAKLMALGSLGLYLFIYLQNIYSNCTAAWQTNKIVRIMQRKMQHVAAVVDAGAALRKLCHGADIELGNTSAPTGETQIESLVAADVFRSAPTYWDNKGCILRTYRQFVNGVDQLLPTLRMIGQVDFLVGLAKLYARGGYSFPKYIGSDDDHIPKINVRGLWHPYLNREDVVENDVKIDHNMLITGPNAGGKSTFIKSVALTALFAQTIGLVPCSGGCSITPFGRIETYLHIPDCKGRESLFQAEMHRCREYLEAIRDGDSGSERPSLIIMDEIFSSTNYVEGYAGAYAICKHLSEYSHSMTLITTHYTDLEELEDETDGRVRNWRFGCERVEGGFQFPYKLEEGVSRDYIALDLLRLDGFDEEIVKTAQARVVSLNSKENNEAS